MTQQEKKIIKEDSNEIASIIQSMSEDGFKPSEFDIGYIQGVVDAIKSQKEKGDPTCQNS